MVTCQQFQEIISFAKKAGWAICPKRQESLGHSLTKPGPSTKNTDKFLANFAKNSRQSAKNTDKFLDICQEILDYLPRMPNNPWPSAKKSRAICQEYQQNPQPSAKIAKNCHQNMPAKNTESAFAGPGCRLIRQPRQPINSETEFSKASQGHADEFIVRVLSKLQLCGITSL